MTKEAKTFPLEILRQRSNKPYQKKEFRFHEYYKYRLDLKYVTKTITETINLLKIKVASLFLIRNSHRRCSVKKVFLETSQNPQENTCVRVSLFNKVAVLGLQLY